jgi:hypothetical protein
MPWDDLSPLSHFKELHLVPRLIFTIGAALFFGGLFRRDWGVSVLGISLAFFSLAYNFAANSMWREGAPPYRLRIWWWNVFQGLIVLAMGVFAFYIVAYHFRYGDLPRFLKPLH